MEGRRLRGEGIENIQDYIEERMTEAGDVDEIAESNEQLEEELRDLRGLEQQPSSDVLETTANSSVGSAESPNEAATAASVGPVDPEQLPPVSAARSQVVNDAGGGETGS